MVADRPHASLDGGPPFEAARLQLARLRVESGARLRDAWLQLAELAAATLQVERVGVWVLLDEDRAIRCRYLLQRSSRQVFQDVVLRAQDFPAYFAAMSERRVIAASDACSSEITQALRHAYLEPLGITSLLDAPIYLDGRLAGIVCHEHVGAARTWTSGECDFAVSVADHISRLYGEHARHNVEAALKAHQRHLMQLHRMEALGRMAAGVAHDFRSILGAAMGFAELIQRAPDTTQQIGHYAQRIIDALQRGHELTREVTELGRDEARAPRVLDVCELTDTFENMFRVLLTQDIRFEVQYRRPVSRVFMDPSQLERTLLNLVLNARDAMPSGGSLSITVEDAVMENDDGDPVTYVAISVSDTGVGMDAQTCADAFKPFFTTKGEKGTGLGLAIVEQIVTRAGGFARIQSEPGRGTTVRVYIPRIAAALG